jgi:hypothetical protein
MEDDLQENCSDSKPLSMTFKHETRIFTQDLTRSAPAGAHLASLASEFSATVVGIK